MCDWLDLDYAEPKAWTISHKNLNKPVECGTL